MNRAPLVCYQRGQLSRLRVSSALIDKKCGMLMTRKASVSKPTQNITGNELGEAGNKQVFEETQRQLLGNIKKRKEVLARELDVLEKESQLIEELSFKESATVTVAPKPSYDILGAPGTRGNKDGMYNCPYGLAVDKDGFIIVADSWNSRVQIFSSSGQFISKFGSEGKEIGQVSLPQSIAINKKGEIILSEYNNNRISVFTREGQFLRSFSSRGTGNGQLSRPDGVAVDSNNNVIVADCDNNRVQVFSPNGDFITSFGSKGKENGKFNGPYGVAVDRKGNILVTDSLNDRVQMFSPSYEFIAQFGEGKLSFPWGLSITPRNEIVVCSFDNKKLCVFDEEGKHLRDVALPAHPRFVTAMEGGTALVSFYDHAVRSISYV